MLITQYLTRWWETKSDDEVSEFSMEVVLIWPNVIAKHNSTDNKNKKSKSEKKVFLGV